MLLRKAKPSDKLHVLKFCKNTFFWGDYIKDVWNFWIKEGHLLVIVKDVPIGFCHAIFSKNQVWIEGIRINSKFRRQGLASNLLIKIESMASKKQIPILLMLIDTENSSSLLMVKNLGFKKNQTWKFYSLLSKKNHSSHVSVGNILQKKEFPFYVKSWRWLPLTQETISKLDSKNQIIFSQEKGKKTVAILQDSEHFEKTLIVTLFSGSKNNTLNIISFLQNYGFEKKYQRIQILTKETLPEFKNLEHKISFHLMKKLLS
ncbi:MAG: GNAT family N-acetyltransferase [Nitrosopumilaceae archaeon]